MIHLKKLSVGTQSLIDLISKQNTKSNRGIENIHITRNFPKRSDELINGGSIFWVIKSKIQARQKIIDIREVNRIDGTKACGIFLENKIYRVWPQKVKIFQGWRYLKQSDIPEDIPEEIEFDDLENSIYNELKKVGLL